MDKKAGDALTDEDLRGPPPPDERPAPPPADGEEGGRLTTAEMEAARCCTRFQRVVMAFPYAATLYFVLTQKLKVERSRPAHRTHCYVLVIFFAPTRSSSHWPDIRVGACRLHSRPRVSTATPEPAHLEETPPLSFLLAD